MTDEWIPMTEGNRNVNMLDLWIKIRDDDQIYYLADKSHTGRGILFTFLEDGQFGRRTEYAHIEDASPLAWAWIDGFLAGSEFEFDEYMGIDRELAETYRDDDPAMERWRGALRRFRLTGSPSRFESRPSEDLSPDYPWGRTPWAYAGEEVWEWHEDTKWSVPQEQPDVAREGAYLLESLCFERDDHEDENAVPGMFYCVDCGRVWLIEPYNDAGD